MKMRAENTGRKLKVRWTTEEWSPTITHLEAGEGIELLRNDVPLLKKTVRRKRPIVWTEGLVRFNRVNLPGLNGSRTSWR